MKTKIFAHRGASLIYPENSLEAFREAIRLGADGIELDVQRCNDGKLVVVHDEELTRLTGKPGLVRELSLSELQSRRIHGHNENVAVIPTLDDVLDLLSGTSLEINIELKNNLYPAPGLEEDVILATQQCGLDQLVIYSSFNHVSMKHMADLGHGDKTALLFSEWLYRPWDYAGVIGATSLHPSYNVLQYPNLINVCHKNNLAIRTWTVDLPEHIKLVLELEPDAIITNELALAIELRTHKEMQNET